MRITNEMETSEEDYLKAQFSRLNKHVAPMEIQHNLSLVRYAASARQLLSQAQVYHREGSYERAFIMFQRFATLILETLPRHKDYATQSSKFKQLLTECGKALDEGAAIKAILIEKFKGYYRELYERQQAQLAQEEAERKAVAEKEAAAAAEEAAKSKLPPRVVVPPTTDLISRKRQTATELYPTDPTAHAPLVPAGLSTRTKKSGTLIDNPTVSLVSWQPALTPDSTEVEDPFASSRDLLAELPDIALAAPEPPAVENAKLSSSPPPLIDGFSAPPRLVTDAETATETETESTAPKSTTPSNTPASDTASFAPSAPPVDEVPTDRQPPSTAPQRASRQYRAPVVMDVPEAKSAQSMTPMTPVTPHPPSAPMPTLRAAGVMDQHFIPVLSPSPSPPPQPSPVRTQHQALPPPHQHQQHQYQHHPDHRQLQQQYLQRPLNLQQQLPPSPHQPVVQHQHRTPEYRRPDETQRNDHVTEWARRAASQQLRTVVVYREMLADFLKVARSNTSRGIETCGILAGSLSQNTLFITTLIIPKQQGTENTCTMLNEEELFLYMDKFNLITIGWIHTHPTQDCFMSSIDLHTHCGYQSMLTEAIAIVMAPSRQQHGIFKLHIPDGLSLIQKCTKTGFHAHSSVGPIYVEAGHVKLVSSRNYRVVDLR